MQERAVLVAEVSVVGAYYPAAQRLGTGEPLGLTGIAAWEMLFAVVTVICFYLHPVSCHNRLDLVFLKTFLALSVRGSITLLSISRRVEWSCIFMPFPG